MPPKMDSEINFVLPNVLSTAVLKLSTPLSVVLTIALIEAMSHSILSMSV